MLREQLAKLEQTAELENRKVILSLLEPDKFAKVLDLGCCDGNFTLEVGKRIGTEELYGVDVVEQFVHAAQAKGIKVYCDDLNESLPLDSGSFDVVHANQVLEHLSHTDLFIKEIRRVLKKGGYAVISTPNLGGWHNIACLFLGWQPFSTSVSDEIHVGNPLHTRYRIKAGEGEYPYHRRVPTYRGLKELFQYHGFQVEKIVGASYYPFPARVLSRLDPRHSVYLTMKVRKV